MPVYLSVAEILVAIAIIVFATIAIIQLYLSSLNFSEINNEDNIAMSHLSNIMEAIKCTPFSNMVIDFPNGVPDGPAGNNYATIVGNYILTGEHIVVSYVNPGSDPLEIIASVSWQDRRGVTREFGAFRTEQDLFGEKPWRERPCLRSPAASG